MFLYNAEDDKKSLPLEEHRACHLKICLIKILMILSWLFLRNKKISGKQTKL